jgi:hypothetical protein
MPAATVTATGQRSSPWVLRRHGGGAVVQPLARVHALCLKTLRHQPVQLVDPVVQRPDAVDDLGRCRGAFLRRRPRFVVTYASHRTSEPSLLRPVS